MAVPMRSDDPAYWMLERGRSDPSWRSKRHVPVREGCYICEDDEFELMGLPLCRACPMCKIRGELGHIPADDEACDDCGFSGEILFYYGGLNAWCHALLIGANRALDT
jgi:hypothetical protein